MSSVLKGRPERPKASMPESQTSGDRAARADSDVVKVTTRLAHGQARAMRVAAAQAGISLEDAYADAVAAWLRGR